MSEIKTVADAYEWADGEWKHEDCNVIGFKGKFLYGWKDYSSMEIICTREQFEDYAKEQEAKEESEKWTHKDGVSECRVICDNGELSWVEYKTGENYVVRNDCLKPIKPKLTKAQAWDLIQDYEGLDGLVRYILRLHEQYDII